MKLAFCLFKYFPFGGLQRDFLRIARVCIERGHQVDVYTSSWEGEKPKELSVFIIKNRGLTNHRRYASFSKRLAGCLNSKRYNAVVGFNKMFGLGFYFAADTCYAAKAYSRSPLYRLTGRCRTLLRLENAVFNQQSKTKILLISDRERPVFIKYYKTSEKRFYLLPPGISKKFLTPDDPSVVRKALLLELAIDSNKNIVLMVGSGFKTKGVDRSIRALSSLPGSLCEKTILLVVGKDKTKPYERLAKKLGLKGQVVFAGGRKDVVRFFMTADIMLHPAYRENTGTVIIEAMAAGLPVLATDVCGYGHHVAKAGAGVLIPSPFDQKDLNGLLFDMLTSKQRVKWQKNGKKYIAETDVFSLPEKAADIIEQVNE